MASPNNPISSAELIRTHSHARVLAPSHKAQPTGRFDFLGNPILTRPMTDADVREALIRQHC